MPNTLILKIKDLLSLNVYVASAFGQELGLIIYFSFFNSPYYPLISIQQEHTKYNRYLTHLKFTYKKSMKSRHILS